MTSNKNADPIDGVLNAIYEAGADAQMWNGVLSQLTERMGGSGAVLHIGDTNCSGFAFGANHQLDPDALAAYAQYYFSINPLNPPLTRQPAGAVVSDDMLVPRSSYESSEFFNDYARRFDIVGSATAVLAKSDGQIACLGVVQPFGTDPYAQAELVLLQRLLPHLQRAVDLNRKLAACRGERDQAWAALNAMELAVAFLGADGTVRGANTACEALFRSGGGINVRGRRPVAANVSANGLLQGAIDAALKMRGGGAARLPYRGRADGVLCWSGCCPCWLEPKASRAQKRSCLSGIRRRAVPARSRRSPLPTG